MLKVCYAEEFDQDFIRWTGNLLRSFLIDGRIGIVGRQGQPDLMLASIWRKHRFPRKLPVALITNENWQVFPPHYPLSRYAAVIGIYPPSMRGEAPGRSERLRFIQYPYEAVHFDLPLDRLFALRERQLKIPKSKFCCFVVSNTVGNLATHRADVFRKINAYRKVDSAGKLLNNTGYRAPRGVEFLDWIAQYKYMICPENSKAPAYVTEKALQASLAGTVPIYAGGGIDAFNTNAFVDASRPDYFSELIRLENDDLEYEAVRQRELYQRRPSLQAFEAEFAKLFLDSI